jgi:major membrane immunogen (membrane-anchored lipoprotein)
MNKLLLIVAFLVITGCSTSVTKGSFYVVEYKTIESMNQHATKCIAIDDIAAEYSVLKINPEYRTKEASSKLKDAAFDKGANTVVKTSTFYGNNSDKSQGKAYQCSYG